METIVRKRIGEFGILFLYLIIEGYGLWPISHFFALLAGLAGIVFLIFLDGEFSERQIFSAAIVLWVICVTIDFLSPPISPEQWRGWLQPAKDPTPDNGCTHPEPDMPRPPVALPLDTPVLVLGTYGLQLSTENRRFAAISIGTCKSLAFERSVDGIKVSAELYDAQGDHIGDIEDNGYDINKFPYLVVEHTGDLSTLIVHDADKKELLFVHYANSNAIQVQGEFYCPSNPNLSVIISRNTLQVGKITMIGCSIDNRTAICLDCRK